MRSRAVAVVSFVAAWAGLTTGCIEERRHITPEGGGPWPLAIDEGTPAFFESDEISLFLVEERVLIDFRQPTEEELAELGDIEGLSIPYGQLPWLQRGDIEIQVDYTLSNLTDDTVTAGIQINGINEFHEYNPGVTIVDDELLIDFSQYERTVRLEPMERLTGTIREEVFDEIAVDLATVVNGAPNPQQVVYFLNHSDHDARSQAFIPDVVPTLTGVRVGVRSLAAVPLLMEFTVRVRDVRDVLVDGDDEPWPAPQPALFGPADVVAAEDEG